MYTYICVYIYIYTYIIVTLIVTIFIVTLVERARGSRAPVPGLQTDARDFIAPPRRTTHGSMKIILDQA